MVKKLILIRHGESKGNKLKVIQGNFNNYDLTKNGEEQIRANMLLNRYIIENATTIISSPLKRAKQTAEIIMEYINKSEILFSDLLVEMDSGILSNMSHQVASLLYPEEYATWCKRGDLDTIPYAEKGDVLQARALSFLVQYMNKDNYCDIVVTHAGFLRCIINTIRNRGRINSININNACIYEINDPWIDIDYSILKKTEKVDVFSVRTCDLSCVIKRFVKKLDKFQLWFAIIHKQLYRDGYPVHELLISVNVSDQNNIQYGIKVFRYIDGKHNFAYLNNKNILELVILTAKIFFKINQTSYPQYAHTLRRKIKKYIKLLGSSKLAEIGEILLYSKYFQRLDVVENRRIVLYDIHRSNIIFTHQGIKLIDLDGVIVAPSEYQAACFLVSTLLVNDINSKNINSSVDFTLRIWNEYFSLKEDILFLSLIRVFTGLAHFFLLTNKEEKELEIMNNYIECWKYLFILCEKSNIIEIDCKKLPSYIF